MTETVKGAFERYGARCEIERKGERIAVRAFLQPVTRETWDEPMGMGPLGAVDERIWRYIGEGSVALFEGDTLIFEGERYRVRRTEAVYAGQKLIYRWAAVSKEVEK